jgi:ketosteroid isomerase-like protein
MDQSIRSTRRHVLAQSGAAAITGVALSGLLARVADAQEATPSQVSAADEVRQASAQFYAALNQMVNGDASDMRELWVDDDDATALHPIGDRDEGTEQVLASFAEVAAIASGGELRLTNQLIRVGGDLAYEVGVEEGESTLAGEQVTVNQRVTNIYRYEDGKWKMIHHHTDASPAMQDLVTRLQQSE